MSAWSRFDAALGRCAALTIALSMGASCEGANPAFQGAVSLQADGASADQQRDAASPDGSFASGDAGGGTDASGSELDASRDAPEPPADAGAGGHADVPPDGPSGALDPDAGRLDAVPELDLDAPAPMPGPDAAPGAEVGPPVNADAGSESDVGLEGGEPAGLRGEYFQGTSFEAPKLTRIDPTIDFEWRSEAPAPELAADQFSVRWAGYLRPRFSEVYTLGLTSDDGVRLWVDDLLLIDAWYQRPTTLSAAQITLTAGRRYRIKVEYFENNGWAVARLTWASASQPSEIIPSSALSPP